MVVFEKQDNVSACSSNHYAVFVGTSYSTWAKNSAKEFNTTLRKNGYWGDEDDDNVRVLLGADATKNNILNAIDWLSEKDSDDAVLLFYIIGHTQKTLFGKFFSAEDKYISDIEFQTHFAKISSKSKLVLIFDTCYSGRMDNVDKTKSKNMFLNHFLNNHNIINFIKQKLTFNLASDDDQDGYDGLFQDLVKIGRIVMTACRTGQLAWRGPGNMGAFTYYLKKAIDNGENMAEGLFNYAKEPTHGYVLGEYGAFQTPQMSDKCSGDVRIV